MQWLLWAMLTAVLFGTYNFFIKVSSGHIHEVAGAVILQIVAALLGGLMILILKIKHVPMEISSKGISYAILAGISVGLAEITTFYVFSKGVPVSVGMPVILGVSVIITSVLGILFLKELLTSIQCLAIMMIVGGVAILAAK